jgi:hypothetical protein
MCLSACRSYWPCSIISALLARSSGKCTWIDTYRADVQHRVYRHCLLHRPTQGREWCLGRERDPKARIEPSLLLRHHTGGHPSSLNIGDPAHSIPISLLPSPFRLSLPPSGSLARCLGQVSRREHMIYTPIPYVGHASRVDAQVQVSRSHVTENRLTGGRCEALPVCCTASLSCIRSSSIQWLSISMLILRPRLTG